MEKQYGVSVFKYLIWLKLGEQIGNAAGLQEFTIQGNKSKYAITMCYNALAKYVHMIKQFIYT